MSGRSALTLGVEEEFLLVDGDGRLAAAGPEISEQVSDEDGQVEHELRRCQVESATDVCETAEEVVDGLRGLRDRLAAEAAEQGLRLLASGTAPMADDRPARFTPDVRYHRMAREFGAIALASLTCACHVHVGIPDAATGLHISNHVRPWLPVLLALTANSPYRNGEDTAYASARHLLWQRWPSAGPPPHFDSVDEYESRVDALTVAGAAFDRGMIYWDVRLSAHQPTVEVRIADVLPTPTEAALLAVLVRGLAAQALDTDTPAAIPPPEVLRAWLWRSARDGLTGRCVAPRTGRLVPAWQVVNDLVADLEPWLRANDDADFAAHALDQVRAAGNGAQRQRAAHDGAARMADVLDLLAWPT
ncbi:glutamate--cysteine ligase [Kutzneria buriramensis]|uniref:Putative glutamate--cysteine ligase 2 n=1 Tax=Kutzneria buriramensis TaxID=1045776 RepID=A0A3E0H7Q1_9PSEU|nr:glutamate--cysteine ligase [Kutzneria buriramensis]REH39317.1 carboxylate-amine ligase [Kutzneria buriramensis]